ncbi:MAG: YidC/Oxa1 family membrane protein insertase [Lachnospiraceae bacterium]|nr:YidC/Oxa1 family membrane protein insertase [Lachnospiraceae bacterium]
MQFIYWMLDTIGIANIGLCIILFTIIMYLLMLPLTIKQQKFSKMSAIMNPEIKAIQSKYKDKKDQDSMMKQNQEIQAVYQKYGVSATGGCLQMLIQLPILFALYQVIMRIPAYVPALKVKYQIVVEAVKNGGKAVQQLFIDNAASAANMDIELAKTSDNSLIDAMTKFTSEQIRELGAKLPEVKDSIDKILSVNGFIFRDFSLADSPSATISRVMDQGINSSNVGLLIMALAIPLLAGITQFINTKLMPQNPASDDNGGTMASSLKTMNMVMPVMSVIFCFSFASGLGLYWVMGSVVRSIQQVIINKHFEKMDINELVKKNLEKVNEKRAKMGLPPQKISNTAKQSTKNIEKNSTERKKIAEGQAKKSSDYYNRTSTAKQGSLKSKANMVKQYNDKNKK